MGGQRAGRGAVQFKREVRAVGKLEHPHIVRALDAGEEDGAHYLAMEYVPGCDLGRLADRLGPLGVADACALIRQAALGLQHAHEHGLIHRDVKPSNLILASGGATPPGVKVVDFGLALLADHSVPSGGELTGRGQFMGTLDYMAPEQGGDCHGVDHRADLYSLGATLYRLLSGKPPLAAPVSATPLQKVMALAVGETIPLRHRRPDVPEPLAALVARLLSKNPADRPASAAEVADALAPFCHGADLAALLNRAMVPVDTPTPVAAPPSPGKPTPARTRPRRLRPALAALGVAAVLLAGGFVIRVATDKGELVIRSSDPDVEVTVMRNGVPVRDIELTRGETRVGVRSGDIEVILKGTRADAYEIRNNRVVLSRGEAPVVEIVRRPIPTAPPVPDDPDRATTEWVLSAGGWVTVNKERREVKTRDNLPAQPFRTIDVFLPGSRTIDNTDLRRLQPLRELNTLDITGTRIADDGLAGLIGIKTLGGLRADFTLVTSRGMEHLKEMTNLQYLSLGGTAVTDDGLRHLKDLPRLSDLGVPKTSISDAGLGHLSGRLSLTRLRLQHTVVSDDGLPHLYSLTRLVEVDLHGTRVTGKGVEELRKALPKCKVLWDGMPPGK